MIQRRANETAILFAALDNNNCHLPKCQNIFHQYTTDATRYVIQNTPQLKLQTCGVVVNVRQNSNRSLQRFSVLKDKYILCLILDYRRRVPKHAGD
jgi:hypothetical protein